MLAKEMLVTLYDFNTRANARVLELAGRLSAEQYTTLTGQSHSNLQGLLVHVVRTMWVWRMLSQHSELPGTPPYTVDAFPSLEKLEIAWVDEDRLLRSYVESLDDETLGETVLVRDWQGNISPMVRWQMLVHLLMHNMQHRTEASAILTGFGHSPGDLDFIFFL